MELSSRGKIRFFSNSKFNDMDLTIVNFFTQALDYMEISYEDFPSNSLKDHK